MFPLKSIFFQLQEIQKKFEDFTRTVSINAETYQRVDKFAKTLVADGHTETVTIKDEQDILRYVRVIKTG